MNQEQCMHSRLERRKEGHDWQWYCLGCGCLMTPMGTNGVQAPSLDFLVMDERHLMSSKSFKKVRIRQENQPYKCKVQRWIVENWIAHCEVLDVFLPGHTPGEAMSTLCYAIVELANSPGFEVQIVEGPVSGYDFEEHEVTEFSISGNQDGILDALALDVLSAGRKSKASRLRDPDVYRCSVWPSTDLDGIWESECEELAVFSQGNGQDDAILMLCDAINLLVGEPDFEVKVVARSPINGRWFYIEGNKSEVLADIAKNREPLIIENTAIGHLLEEERAPGGRKSHMMDDVFVGHLWDKEISKYDFNPNWASPPGDTLREILEDGTRKRGLCEDGEGITWMADQMQMTREEFNRLLSGRVWITDDMAKRIASRVGPSAEFWINRELQYRQKLKELREKLYDSVDSVPSCVEQEAEKFISDKVKNGYHVNVGKEGGHQVTKVTVVWASEKKGVEGTRVFQDDDKSKSKLSQPVYPFEEPSQGSPSVQGYFAYDYNDFISFHDTEEEARETAEGQLDAAGDEAADYQWSEQANEICYGKVIGRARHVRTEPAPPDHEAKEFHFYEMVREPDSEEQVKPEVWPGGICKCGNPDCDLYTKEVPYEEMLFALDGTLRCSYCASDDIEVIKSHGGEDDA